MVEKFEHHLPIITTILIVALGGAVGSVGRYLLQVYFVRQTTLTFPLGTLLVNLSGCFLIGVFFALSTKYAWMTMEWRLFLMTGICGGYTTFSSFSLESINLLRQGHYPYFFLYILGSVIAGLFATVAGFAIIR
jgi:fluoride exporter